MQFNLSRTPKKTFHALNSTNTLYIYGNMFIYTLVHACVYMHMKKHF